MSQWIMEKYRLSVKSLKGIQLHGFLKSSAPLLEKMWSQRIVLGHKKEENW